jgi:hypothetical protein
MVYEPLIRFPRIRLNFSQEKIVLENRFSLGEPNLSFSEKERDDEPARIRTGDIQRVRLAS